MANGIAVGNFAQGLSQGLKSGLTLGREIKKEEREAEKYELEKPALEAQAERVKRQQAALQQVDRDYSAWQQSNMFDPDGNPLAPDQAPSELVSRAAYFNIYNKAMLENQAVDPEKMAQMAKFGKELKGEGIVNAMDTWFRTGDTQKTLAVWNSMGNIKAPEGTSFQTVTDEMGKNDVAIIGPDGKQLGTFNQALFFLSADNVAKSYGDDKRSIFEQKQANNRTAISAGASVEAAKLAQSGAMDRQLLNNQNDLDVASINAGAKGVKDPVFDQIQEAVVGLTSKFASNAGIAMDPASYTREVMQISGQAYRLVREAKAQGKSLDVFTASAMAMKQLGFGETTGQTTK